MIRNVLILLSVILTACTVDDAESERSRPAKETLSTDAGFAETCGTSSRQWKAGQSRLEATPSSWEPSCFYPVEDVRFGRYLNEQNDPFEITMESGNTRDYWNLGPYEVAELAYWMTAVHALMDLPCQNADKPPYYFLSKGHFVVVDDKEVFAELYGGDKNVKNVGAFIRTNRLDMCYNTPEDVYWSSVVRSSRWSRGNVDLVVHEMTHILSLSVNGHADPEHEDARLWQGAGGDNSLMAIVINIHDCQYFPTECIYNPRVGGM